MGDEAQQLSLFASSESKSTTESPSSPRSSAPEMSSSAPRSNTSTAATTTTRTRLVPERSTRDGVAAAATSRADASTTAASEPQLTLPTITPPNTADKMLSVPRPTTRAECLEEARPCPWVGCPHHLLLEVSKARKRAVGGSTQSMRLNQADRVHTKLGRRRGLASSAADLIVRAWIDDAVELLSRMPFTCALDVVDAYPDGLSERAVAYVYGVTEQRIGQETNTALWKHKQGMWALGVEDDDA